MNTQAAATPAVTPLDKETRLFVDTDTAAFHLMRKPQTMRAWACHQDGLLRPVKIGNRLGWRVADIKALMGLTA
jgi:hypothetical protein